MSELPIALAPARKPATSAGVVVHALHGDLVTAWHGDESVDEWWPNDPAYVTGLEGPSGEDEGEVLARQVTGDVIAV